MLARRLEGLGWRTAPLRATRPVLLPLLRTFASSPAVLGQRSRPSKDPLDSFYSDSLYLPKTAFPLRAEASKREKLFWKRTTDELYEWQVRRRSRLFARMPSAELGILLMEVSANAQAKQKDRPLFVLHDGPPYANGHLHCGASLLLSLRASGPNADVDTVLAGHALNKITKDLINRSKLIQGYRVQSVQLSRCVLVRTLLCSRRAATRPASTPTASPSNSKPSRPSQRLTPLSPPRKSVPPLEQKPKKASRSRKKSFGVLRSWEIGRGRIGRWIGSLRGGS